MSLAQHSQRQSPQVSRSKRESTPPVKSRCFFSCPDMPPSRIPWSVFVSIMQDKSTKSKRFGMNGQKSGTNGHASRQSAVFSGALHGYYCSHAAVISRSFSGTLPSWQATPCRTANKESLLPPPLDGKSKNAVQNIARESRLTLSHRRIILPHFSRVGFYPTLSYPILLYPTSSYSILLYPTLSYFILPYPTFSLTPWCPLGEGLVL